MSNMLLYHFTTKESAAKISQEGITRCLIPWDQNAQKTIFKPDFQWLTADPNFESQLWANFYMRLPGMFLKTEYRLTVEIPQHAHDYLIRWNDFKRIIPKNGINFITANLHPDAHWGLFAHPRGIPANWIIESIKTPRPIARPSPHEITRN